VLVGLVLVQLTGARWIDPVVALAVAVVVVRTGLQLLTQSGRVLVDEALPAGEVEAIREAIEGFSARGVVGYHELRTRRAGSRRYVDLHVQFQAGTSLKDAHRVAHELRTSSPRAWPAPTSSSTLSPRTASAPARCSSATAAPEGATSPSPTDPDRPPSTLLAAARRLRGNAVVFTPSLAEPDP
jgi:hypothetical protein